MTSDPKKNPDAKRFERLTYIDALNMRVGVMDSTAMAMCMDNDLPIMVLNLWEENCPGAGRVGRDHRHDYQCLAYPTPRLLLDIPLVIPVFQFLFPSF
jgi:aspartokinase